MIKSQLALHPELADPFYYLDLDQSNLDTEALRKAFENNRLLLVDGLNTTTLDQWMDWPTSLFHEWVPPVMSTAIRNAPIDEAHPLWPFYQSYETIKKFRDLMNKFEVDFSKQLKHLFPFYQPRLQIYSWRFNKMDLGYLHLDIPPETEDHQFRAFVNLSRRPRLIEIGPSVEELLSKIDDPDFFESTKDENIPNFFKSLKQKFFKKQGMEDFFLPRHYLRLAPGAIWICHSSLITHGLIYGEKTLCCEWRIPTDQLESPRKSFQSRIANARINKASPASWGYDGQPSEFRIT